MTIEEITREVHSLMRELLRRDMRPVHLFVDHGTYLAIKCWAADSAFVRVYVEDSTKDYFNGLELHEVDCIDRFIVVAP